MREQISAAAEAYLFFECVELGDGTGMEFVRVPKKSLPDFAGVLNTVNVAGRIFDEALSEPYVAIGRARLYVFEDDFLSAKTIYEQFALTASQLKANAASDDPKPLRLAVSNWEMVGFVQAVSVASHKYKVSSGISFDGAKREFPTLDLANFSDVSQKDSRTKHGTFGARGFCFGERDELSLFVEGGLELVLPQDDAAWAFDTVYKALATPVWFEGGIERVGSGGKWRVLPGSKLVTQTSCAE